MLRIFISLTIVIGHHQRDNECRSPSRAAGRAARAGRLRRAARRAFQSIPEKQPSGTTHAHERPATTPARPQVALYPGKTVIVTHYDTKQKLMSRFVSVM